MTNYPRGEETESSPEGRLRAELERLKGLRCVDIVFGHGSLITLDLGDSDPNRVVRLAVWESTWTLTTGTQDITNSEADDVSAVADIAGHVLQSASLNRNGRLIGKFSDSLVLDITPYDDNEEESLDAWALIQANNSSLGVVSGGTVRTDRN